MIVGILLMLFYMIKYKLGGFGGGTVEDWWFGVSPEGFGTIAGLVNFVVAIVISRFTQKPPSHVQDIVQEIRYPAQVVEGIDEKKPEASDNQNELL